jgi:hypothetical protein
MPSDDPNFDIMRLTEKQRRALLKTRDVVLAFEQALREGRELGMTRDVVIPRLIRRLASRRIHVSRRTLDRWRREFRSSGLVGLIDQRWLHGMRQRGERAAQLAPFFAELARRYTGRGLLSARMCHDLASEWAARQGLPAATLRESWRFIKTNVLPRLTRERGMVRRPRDGSSNDI